MNRKILALGSLVLMMLCIVVAFQNYMYTSSNSATIAKDTAELAGEGDLLVFSFDGEQDLWHDFSATQVCDYDFYASIFVSEGAVEVDAFEPTGMTFLAKKEHIFFDYSLTYDSEGDEDEHYTTERIRFKPEHNTTHSIAVRLDSTTAEFRWELKVLFIEPEAYDTANTKAALGLVGAMIMLVITLVVTFQR